MNKIICLILLTVSSSTVADTCDALLQGGIRDNYSVMTYDEKFNSYQSALCDENYTDYGQFTSGVRNLGFKSINADGVLGLTGSTSKKKSQFNSAYSKFCSENYTNSEFKSSFRNKSSLINTDLAKAFNTCVSTVSSYMSKNSKQIYIDVTPQSNFSSFTVRITRQTNSQTEVSEILPSNVSCTLNNTKVIAGTHLQGTSILMECIKPPKDNVAFSLSTKGEGNSNEVNVPAEKDRLAEIEQQLQELQEAVTLQSPKNVVIAVEDNQCPDGWEDYAPAFGNFIRGIDKTNSKIDPDGQRVAGSLQSDGIGKHSHSTIFLDVKYPRGSEGDQNRFTTARTDWSRPASHIQTGEAGIEETRPKNVALLFCKKKNN